MGLFKIIVFSNVWIAFGAVSVVMCNANLLGLDVSFKVGIIVFCLTFCSYNIQRWLKHKNIIPNRSERQEWVIGHKLQLNLLSILSGIAAFVLLLMDTSITHIILVMGVGVISILYSFQLPLRFMGCSLRQVPYAKAFIVALVWSLMVVVFPFYGKVEGVLLFRFFVFWFCYVTAITIPFDVRDKDFDRGNLKTFALLWSVAKLKVFILILLIFAFLFYDWKLSVFVGLLFMTTSVVVLSFLSDNRKELYYSGVIDGLLVFSLPVSYFLI